MLCPGKLGIRVAQQLLVPFTYETCWSPHVCRSAPRGYDATWTSIPAGRGNVNPSGNLLVQPGGCSAELSRSNVVASGTRDGVGIAPRPRVTAPAAATFANVRPHRQDRAAALHRPTSTTCRQAAGTCAALPDRLCLNNGRFQSHHVRELRRPDRSVCQHDRRTGYFWFFSAANVEVVLK